MIMIIIFTFSFEIPTFRKLFRKFWKILYIPCNSEDRFIFIALIRVRFLHRRNVSEKQSRDFARDYWRHKPSMRVLRRLVSCRVWSFVRRHFKGGGPRLYLNRWATDLQLGCVKIRQDVPVPNGSTLQLQLVARGTFIPRRQRELQATRFLFSHTRGTKDDFRVRYVSVIPSWVTALASSKFE